MMPVVVMPVMVMAMPVVMMVPMVMMMPADVDDRRICHRTGGAGRRLHRCRHRPHRVSPLHGHSHGEKDGDGEKPQSFLHACILSCERINERHETCYLRVSRDLLACAAARRILALSENVRSCEVNAT